MRVIPVRDNVGCGRDHTLFATADGQVVFETKGTTSRQYVKVVSQ